MEQPPRTERDPATINMIGAKLPTGLFFIGVAIVLISGVLLWYFRDAPRAAEVTEVLDRVEMFTDAVVGGDGDGACAMTSDPDGFAAVLGTELSCPDAVEVLAGSLGSGQSEALRSLPIGDVVIRSGSGVDRAEVDAAGQDLFLVRYEGCGGDECWLLENPAALLIAAGVGD